MARHTLADGIVFALTDEIVSKQLPPGAELDEGRIGERFGASRTPVREALRQLAASGLVELRPHATPRVARIEEDRLRDMFDVMAELEALCASRAALAMNAAQRAKLLEHHRRMGETVRAGDIKAYRAENAVFHALIYAGCGNGYLRDLTLATRTRLDPYRSAQLEAPARMAASYAEHGEIVEAMSRADAARAAALMRAHLATTHAVVTDLGRGGEKIKN